MEWFHFLNLEYLFALLHDLVTGRIFTRGYDLAEAMLALRPAATLFSLFLLSLIVYAAIRISQIRREERETYRARIREAAARAGAPGENIRWRRVLAHLASPNPTEWRLAVMEADIILEEMLAAMSLPGETVGEKLRAVETSDFATLDKAWEAHRVRNRIAHDGAAFELTEREARRVVALYQDVFREFGFV
jgi:hypothetical protein